MLHYMLDTSVCVALLRDRSPRSVTRLERCADDEVGISAITLAELQYGVRRSSDPARHADIVDQFCSTLVVLPFDAETAEAYGRVRASLQQAGTPIGPLDMLIASHALSLELTVVTNNEREFRRVSGLRVENWDGPSSRSRRVLQTLHPKKRATTAALWLHPQAPRKERTLANRVHRGRRASFRLSAAEASRWRKMRRRILSSLLSPIYFLAKGEAFGFSAS